MNPLVKRAILTSFFSEERGLRILEVELELHGIFWFHTFAQPRDKYTHLALPVIHNYPILLALLGLPGEVYASLSGRITFRYKPEDVWRSHGFYVHPAVVERAVSKILTFSAGGTGYVQFKPQTRASFPDYTANQVYLPGTVFKTYIVTGNDYTPPSVIRLGAKRYGVFRVKVRWKAQARIEDGAGKVVTHPFNVRDVEAVGYHGILRHYAGTIALGGLVRRVLVAGRMVLALPRFIEV